MSALDLFRYQGQQVRTVLVDGEPWFVASDVASVLGYSATEAMTRSMDPDEKGLQILHTPGGDQRVTVISEPGLYDAILRSRIPQARDFKRWVKHDVLPQIRRTGQFGSQIPASFAEALELAAANQRQIEAAEARLLEQAPKVEAYDALMDADGYYSMEQAAKAIGVGRTTLFRRMREDGVIVQGGRTPTQRYAHHFKVTVGTYTDGSGQSHPTYTTKVRPEAMDWLRRRYAAEVTA